MFFDQAKIHVAAGNGGSGCVSFRREKHVPRGGPDGGDGGRGGDVVLYVDPQVRDLQLFTYKVHFKGGAGQAGRGAKKHGSNGDTVRIPVPVGTQVWAEQASGAEGTGDAQNEGGGPAADSAENGLLVADLIRRGEELVVACGGAGGRGNSRFTNSVHQAPKFAELGESGESGWLRLSLKLMADAGLAGLPNAGKSSLLKRLSNAKPKVAAYPFTTLEPMLGVVDWSGEGDVFTLADVPGLLEGASEGVGLGHEFLAHLERCFLLVHVVDIADAGGPEPLEAFRVILHELEAHAAGLAEKPQLVVLSKIDAVAPEEVEAQRQVFAREVERLRAEGHPAFSYVMGDDAPLAQQMVWPVSASTGAGLRGLVRRIGPMLRELGAGSEAADAADLAGSTVPPVPVGARSDGAPAWSGEVEESAGGGHITYRPTGTSERSFVVRKTEQGFVVEGEAVRRLVRRFDLDNDEAIRYVAEKLDRLGVYAALRAKGAQPGDDVDMEGHAFVFE